MEPTESGKHIYIYNLSEPEGVCLRSADSILPGAAHGGDEGLTSHLGGCLRNSVLASEEAGPL